MIVGTGIDIVELDRFKKAIERRPRLVDRLFTTSEIDYCCQRNKPHLHYAVRFAAKESVAKSLGIGIRNIKWKDIEIAKMASGKPTVVLHNEAKNIADGQDISLLDVSLSFSKKDAIASSIAFNGSKNVK